MSVTLQLERDRACRRVLDLLILNDGVDPDTPLLLERNFSNSLEIGRVPVRKALRNLTRAGILELRPARGTFVRDAF